MYLPDAKWMLVIAILFYKVDTKNIKMEINYQNHHIKWVYSDYPLPIVFTKNIDDSVDADYKWFQMTDSIFVDEIDNHEDIFAQDKINASLIGLYLLKYNNLTHNELASYQPQMIAVRTEGSSSNNIINEFNQNIDVFTLAYLKSHKIIIDDKKDSNKIDYSCSITIIFPFNENNQNLRSDYNTFLENFVYMKMTLSGGDEKKGKTKGKLNHNRIKRDNQMVNFLEMEFKEGPISVYKSSKQKERISCFLKLTDSAEMQVAYENTILKTYDYNFKSTDETSTRSRGSIGRKRIKASFVLICVASVFSFLILILFVILFGCGYICENFRDAVCDCCHDVCYCCNC